MSTTPPPLFLAHIEADARPSRCYAFTSSAERDAFTELADAILPPWYDVEPDAVTPYTTAEAAAEALRATLPA